MLLRGIRDSQDKKYTRGHRVHTKNEALIPLDQSHVNLINNYKKNDVKYAELDSMVRRIGFGNLIKINLTHMPKMPNMPNMPNSEEEVQLEKTNKEFFRDPNIRSTVPVSSTPVQPVSQAMQHKYKQNVIQGEPVTYTSTVDGKTDINFDKHTCTGNNAHTEEVVKVNNCRVLTKNGYRSLEGECDSVPNKCIVNARDTMALKTFDRYPNAKSVQISGPMARDVAHAAAARRALGGKRRKVKKSVKTKKFK